jgi:hypothetical protein
MSIPHAVRPLAIAAAAKPQIKEFFFFIMMILFSYWDSSAKIHKSEQKHKHLPHFFVEGPEKTTSPLYLYNSRFFLHLLHLQLIISQLQSNFGIFSCTYAAPEAAPAPPADLSQAVGQICGAAGERCGAAGERCGAAGERWGAAGEICGAAAGCWGAAGERCGAEFVLNSLENWGKRRARCRKKEAPGAGKTGTWGL